MKNFNVWSRLFLLEPEPTQFGRSRNRLRDLGLPELEQPKIVADAQHWLLFSGQ